MRKGITKEMTSEKIFSMDDVAKLFYEFYDKVKHGDEEHQKWLRDETLKFIAEQLKAQ